MLLCKHPSRKSASWCRTGISARLYQDAFQPMLQVGLFAPGEPRCQRLSQLAHLSLKELICGRLAAGQPKLPSCFTALVHVASICTLTCSHTSARSILPHVAGQHRTYIMRSRMMEALHSNATQMPLTSLPSWSVHC